MSDYPPLTSAEGTDLQGALDEARGEDLPAAQLRQMRDALLRRRRMLSEDLKTAPDDETRQQLQKQLEELESHISILHEEAALTSFVEDSVKFGLEMRRIQEG